MIFVCVLFFLWQGMILSCDMVLEARRLWLSFDVKYKCYDFVTSASVTFGGWKLWHLAVLGMSNQPRYVKNYFGFDSSTITVPGNFSPKKKLKRCLWSQRREKMECLPEESKFQLLLLLSFHWKLFFWSPGHNAFWSLATSPKPAVEQRRF